MTIMNPFRIVGDVSHTLSKCILIWAIHSNKSAEGVSLITQSLYMLVFCTRYINIFSDNPWEYPSVRWYQWWNFVLKNFYIWSSLYIIVLMMKIFPRTREREKAWKLGAASLGGAIILAPIITPIFEGKETSIKGILWSFSEILESVCVLPQLLLLRQTAVPTVIDSFYLLTLGSYRAFYILNWIARAMDPDDKPHTLHPVSIVFGIVQTALYVDFAWVYYTRQRVKLRGGGVVDSDDLSKSWILRSVLGRRSGSMDEEERPALGDEDERAPARNAGRWGARGISVSADEGVLDQPRKYKSDPADAKADEDELGGILEDDEDDDREDRSPPAGVRSNGAAIGVSGGEEWRSGSR
ncbi:MAG: hypothetical protein M1833_002181 [Piccolia ochrophora]|nr:MAG: hypothetical protein M1833_002181 [Piccolia ochrophora]